MKLSERILGHINCGTDDGRAIAAAVEELEQKLAAAERERDELRQEAETAARYAGCGDHSCLFVKPNGMGTNGGCRCIERARPGLAFALGKLFRAARSSEGSSE